jgi:hypothetical protein
MCKVHLSEVIKMQGSEQTKFDDHKGKYSEMTITKDSYFSTLSHYSFAQGNDTKSVVPDYALNKKLRNNNLSR